MPAMRSWIDESFKQVAACAGEDRVHHVVVLIRDGQHQTRVSGATDEMCRVASTPPIPGMLRSITTTSGASSRTHAHGLVPVRLLRRGPARPAPRAGCEGRCGIGRGRRRSARGATRLLAAPLFAATRSAAHPLPGTGSLVDRDRDGPAAPRPGLGESREPEVDPRSPDGAPGVRCDGLAVAGNRQPGAEGDQRGIDGNDAPAHGDARRRVTGERVAGRAHGDRPAARGLLRLRRGNRCGRRRRGRCSGRIRRPQCGRRGIRRRLQLLRLHLRTERCLLERTDLPGLQLSVAAETHDECEPLTPGRTEIACRLLRRRECSAQLRPACGEGRTDAEKPDPRRVRDKDDFACSDWRHASGRRAA